jgi:hypothetical protein
LSKSENGGKGQIRVGNIENSTGIAIGHEAYASVGQSQLNVQGEISGLLTDLIRSLGHYSDYMVDAEAVQRTAADAQAEVGRPSPKWQAVRRMLAAIATSVAGIAALSDAVSNILAIVERIIS